MLKVYHAAGKKASLFSQSALFRRSSHRPSHPRLSRRPSRSPPHLGEKAFARFSHRFSRPRLSHCPSHPPPHRTAVKRSSRAFRTVFPSRTFLTVLPARPHTAPRRKGLRALFAPFFPPASFSPSFPPAPAPHRGEKTFARFSHRFSRLRLFHRSSHPAFFSFFGKSLDKGEKTCYNNSADYQTTVCRTSRRSTQEVEEAPLLRV